MEMTSEDAPKSQEGGDTIGTADELNQMAPHGSKHDENADVNNSESREPENKKDSSENIQSSIENNDKKLTKTASQRSLQLDNDATQNAPDGDNVTPNKERPTAESPNKESTQEGSPKKTPSPEKGLSNMKSPRASQTDIAKELESSKEVDLGDIQFLQNSMDGTGPVDTIHTPESPMEEQINEVKSAAFTGKSTLPRSNTLSTGLASEAGDDDDTINVVVRVRPLNANENSKKERNVMQFPGDGALWIDTGATTKSFTFNVTFEPEASQEDIFDHCGMKKLIEMALNGYSCTAFAFGQTGSGKTHTITGPPELYNEGRPDPSLQGLIPRSFHYLFKLMNESKNIGYRITASYLEIYNEQVIDLLNPTQGRQLSVRWSKHKGFYVENLFVIECEMMDDVMAVLEEG